MGKRGEEEFVILFQRMCHFLSDVILQKVLNGIYEEKKAKCQMVSIEVRKTQHKYIIGQQANNLYEILDKVSGNS